MNEKKKILIVEDEESTRRALSEKITEAGFDVLIAEDGEIGLKLAKENIPDLILSDVIMPKMHGIDMLNILQSEKWGKNIPVIVLTNYAEDPKVMEAEKDKKCKVLNKTKLKLSEVLAKVTEAVNEKK